MAISFIDKKQIRDFNSPTGIYYPTGWTVSGNIAVSGMVSGTSGVFGNVSANTLAVSGPVVSPYLSGALGFLTTGSGIIEFLSPVDSSGNNTHFRHVVHTGDRNFLIQSFSSQDNQTDWFYYYNNVWNAFPALGLNSTEQQASIVRHIYKPTGMDVFSKYFSEFQTIYAANITGAYANSVQFQSAAPGFTVNHIPFLSEYYATSDSRYVRKAQFGSDYVVSGVKISGVPIIVPTFGGIPTSNHGTGTLVQISGQLYNYHEEAGFSGYKQISPITGFVVPSGGAINASKIIISGEGQIATKLVGGNTIVISGGGVNQFALATKTFRQGSLILSGEAGASVREVTSTSGTMYVISGSNTGGGGIGNVTGFGIDLNTILYTGGLVVSGAGSVTASLTNLGGNISGIVISGSSTGGGGGVGNVTGFGVNAGPQFTGGFLVSGEGGISVRISDLGSNTSGIVISGATPSPGGVTGFALNSNSVFKTGAFYLSGSGGTTITMVSGAPNVSGFIISTATTFSISEFDSDQILLRMWNNIGI